MAEKIKFSDDQKAVIGASKQNILVSAAAGSGKTTVLVRRIIERILKEELSVDRMLVVTFTVSAADNMRNKIDNALRDVISEKTASKAPRSEIQRLKKQLDLLPKAYIQTMNAFCTRVLKEKGYELEINEDDVLLSSAVLSESELTLLRKKAISAVLENRYARSFDDEEADLEFISLTRCFGDGRNDSTLENHLDRVFRKLRSFPNYVDRLNEAILKCDERDKTGEILGIRDLNTLICEMYEKASKNASDLHPYVHEIQFAKTPKTAAQKADAFDTFFESTINASNIINGLMKDDSLNDLEKYKKIREIVISEACREDKPYTGMRTKGDDADADEFAVKAGPICALGCLYAKIAGFRAPNGYNDSAAMDLPLGFADLVPFIKSDIETLAKKQKIQNSNIRVFCELLLDLDKQYKKAKRKASGMDFSDQEHCAVEVLKNVGASEYYKNKFTEIYIDEYQDNSALQDYIISLFSSDNVFTVGDVKQSIYKFRYAKPSMFLDKLEKYSRGDSGVLMTLNENYRSSVQILNFANVLFSQLMSEDASEIEYDESQKLKAPEKSFDSELPRVVFVDYTNDNGNDSVTDNDEEIDDDSEDFSEDYSENREIVASSKVKAAEFAGILREVKMYLDMGREPKDICILSRTNDFARKVSAFLREHGYEVTCAEAQNIFTDSLIGGLCSLITSLGNEYRDDSMLAVLLQNYPFTNFTMNEIARITAYAVTVNPDYRKLSLVDRLHMYEENPDADENIVNRIKVFFETFEDIRSQVTVLDIGELIEMIFVKTGVRNASYGENAFAKLSAFKDWICDSFLTRGFDLSYIADSLDDMKLKLDGDVSFRIENNDENKITCMTYHTSKGLEFPVVIVSDLSGGRTNGSEAIGFMDNDDMDFFCDDFDVENKLSSTSLHNWFCSAERRNSEIAENIRLMYVSVTRAQKNLSIVSGLYDKDLTFMNGLMLHEKESFSPNLVSNLKSNNRLFIYSMLRLSAAREVSSRLSDESPCPDFLSGAMTIPFDGVKAELLDSVELQSQVKSLAFDKEIIKESEAQSAERNRILDLIEEEYSYESSVKLPAKTTVSELKRDEAKLVYDTENSDTESKIILPINLIVPAADYFETGIKKKLSASQKGTIIHRMMQYLDFERLIAVSDSDSETKIKTLNDLLDELIENLVIEAFEANVAKEFASELYAYASSELCQRMVEADKSGNCYCEKPVMFSVRLRGNRGDISDSVLVQGIIDAVFTEDNEAVLIDYKTDKLGNDDLEEIEAVIRRRHADQVNMYAASLETSGIKVKEKYIWLVRNGIAVKI